MKKNIKQVFATILVLIILSVAVSAAEYLIPFQGLASDSSSVPLPTGDISVRIYDAATGGSLVYDSGANFNGTITDGIYDVLLGSVTPLDLDDTKKYFLELDINGEEVVGDATSGRQVFWPSAGNHTQSWNDLIDVPAGFADGVDDTGADDDWNISGNNIFRLNGNVGIGTTSPSNKLEVIGNVELTNLFDNDASNFFDGACGDNQHITGISASGAISCGADTGDGDISGVTAGSGLTGGGTSGSVTLNVNTGTTANKVVQLDGSGRLPSVDGSQLTGISAAGDDDWNISGNTVFRLDGNVGIGTTNPGTAKFAVQGKSALGGIDGSPDALLEIVKSGATDILYLSSAANNDGDLFIVKNNGNVGIGTVTPTQKLHVVGDVNITGNLYAGTGSAVLFVDDTNNRVGIGTTNPSEQLVVEGSAPTLLLQNPALNNANSGKIQFSEGGIIGTTLRYDGNLNKFFIDTTSVTGAVTIDRFTGNVGIGTTNPGAKLQVEDGGEYLRVIPNSPANHVTLATPVSHLLLDSGGRVEIDIFGAGDHFKVTQGGSSDLFTVKGNGNVGIGTSSPSEKLEVIGKVKAQDFAYSSPQTEYLTIAGSQCTGRNVERLPDAPFSCGLSSSTSDTDAFWDVNLPGGATVTGFRVHAVVNTGTITCRLRRGLESFGFEMATVTRSGPSSSGWTVEDTTINSELVDTANFAYAVHCTKDIASPFSAIGSIQIKYTMPGPN